MKNPIWIYFKGMAMGAADVVPGVSGGTIAFLMGIYERLLDAIGSFSIPTLRLLFKGEFKAFARKVDFTFLVLLFAGIATSIISFAKLFKYLLENHEVLTMSFFFGLIIATVWVVGRRIKEWNVLAIVWFVIGAALAIGISFSGQIEGSSNPFYLFFCGFIAICSMILPGVSGSFVLLLLGNYALIIGVISDLPSAILEFNVDGIVAGLWVIVPFALGAVTGILSFAKVLSWLFHNYENSLLAILTGFVLGSLSIIYPWKKVLRTEMIHGKVKVLETMRYVPEIDTHFFMAIGLMIIGVVLVASIEYFGNKELR
jgi:putative membrane protein